MVREPMDYEQSSYRSYVSDEENDLVDKRKVLSAFRKDEKEQYRMFVEGKISHAEQEMLIQKDIREDDMWLPW